MRVGGWLRRVAKRPSTNDARFRERPIPDLLKSVLPNPDFARAGRHNRVRRRGWAGTRRPLRQLLTFGGQDMRSAFDFAPFRRSTVGFDRLFDMLEDTQPARPRKIIRRSTSSRPATTIIASSWPSPASRPRRSTSPPSRTC